ncbi:hypothetical protein EJF36_16045 [Bacillus sp. HMF5848]|uniref:cytochrome d ubiquinol oxidase subunit II n=1 Tax=Bacillus sp. HMF5848 TaxID=2495421 RepID=UPI000F782D2E|nr:cytochrome d ubiquinol oxidase subunit II [Bacillus sp. HMF5848]RSK28271.1 hypothetical protein EJF36_16045 [Bacillus sp. HMF5848]
MTDVLIAIALLWGFIFIYAVMATMDFGAGFWSMIYINREKTNATNIANRYLSPTWEVTNTFIVAIVVALITFFPGATFAFGTLLLIPGSLILVLLSIRSGLLVFSHVADDYRKPLTYISGISGLLIPGLLLSVLPITHGGYEKVVGDHVELDLVKLFTSPQEYAFLAFAIASSLFLSSLLLSDFSYEAKEFEAYQIYRKDALITGPISIVIGILIVVTMRFEARWIYDNMLENIGWLIASFLMFLIAGALLFLPNKENPHGRGRPRLAVIAVVGQYFLASFAYGKSHLPYIIYPDYLLSDVFTNPTAFRALFVSYLVGFAILFPGFIYFWRIFTKGFKPYKTKKT